MTLRSSLNLVIVASLAVYYVSGTPAGAVDPSTKCESRKLKEVGKYGACRLIADSKARKKGLASDYTKCDQKYATKWKKIESSVEPGECPTEGDEQTIQSQVATHTTVIAFALAPSRFEDTGDTIIDHQTCLEWEKKIGPADSGATVECRQYGGFDDFCSAPRHVQNRYDWASDGVTPENPFPRDGSLFHMYLGQLNGTTPTFEGLSCLAGHCDWRIPTLTELTTIWNPALCDGIVDKTCIDPIFDPHSLEAYFSSTPVIEDGELTQEVWTLEFGPYASVEQAGLPAHTAVVRAVRTRACKPSCGDGVVQVGEECDDGNPLSGDGCDRQCLIDCTPDCAGQTCGGDGCGGSCGTCTPPEVCSAGGNCVCSPNCVNRECGDDGCGGSCGTCGIGLVCHEPSGTCVVS